MNTKSILTGTAVVLSAWAMVPEAGAREVLSPTAVRSEAVQAQVLFAEDLASGEAADLYKAKCNARKISADVGDQGPFFDTNFQVAVVGSAGGIEGKTSARISPKGGISGLASVSRSTVTNGNLRAYLLYSEVNAPGFEKYDSLAFCTNANGTTENPAITKILDQ